MASPSAPTASTFAWLGAGLFALSLGWFVFSYYVRFPRLPIDGSSPVAGVAWDTALFTAFALHHSAFAREAVRIRIERIAPGRERSVFVWVASLLLAAVCAAWRGVPGTLWSVSGPAARLLNIVGLAGIVLTIRSAAILDVWELAGTRPARHAPGERGGDIAFSRRGPYGWVRHPIYAAWFLVVWALPTMTMTQLVFATSSCVYLVIGMIFEERSLLRAAPESYREYQRAVRWKIVPGIY